jgi:pilus assembly protein CpaB
MMLSRQTSIALGIAVILGLFAVFLANSYLSGTERQRALSGTTKVAVATVPLAYGTDVTPDKVRFVEYPNSSIPPGAFTNAAQLVGKKRVALLPIGVNEPILASKVSAEGRGASIAALLPEGMRAASVRINDVSGVAGFVQPNDSVDVLVTRTIPGSERNTQLTDVLLQNVRVIAIDQRAKNAEGTAKVAKTATLEVTPLDAQKLALAQEVGTLSLVLRKPGEKNNPVVETISMSDLRYNMYGGARYPAPAVVGGFGTAALGQAVSGSIARTSSRVTQASAVRPRPAPRRSTASAKPAAPVRQSRQIEVYRGTQSNQVEVGGNGR